MADATVITGVGMASSLGFDAVTACAAARAGITRPTTLDYEVFDGEALASVAVTARTMGWYTDGFAEVGRLVQLGRPAVADVIRSAGLDDATLTRTAWIVTLADGTVEALAQAADETPPEAREGARPPYAALKPWIEAQVLPGIRAGLSAGARAAPARVRFDGAAGAAVALTQAQQIVREGRAPACVVGGIDARADLRWLDALHTLGWLATPAEPTGLTPGEAAAFVCVEAAGRARARGATVLAVLGETAAGREELSDAPPVGAILAGVVRAALDGASRRPVCLGGLGGGARLAGEWGRAWARLAADLEFADVTYPATAFGDTGAAAGYVAAATAVHAFARGVSAADTAVAWAASDDGLRGAFALSAP
ncbi:hypothetical protein [Rubrivirga sp. IMCC43871]|uniref:hypothetical protein n=1 Tax=Rubrivirga sp. IMCC43871 TaxID=3391575 RepID=UPI003990393D